MPIPETPYTREEAYLNAIATGDSGGIPETPYTREEMYLDAIARKGGGGGGGSSALSGLTDVDISNPTDGQTLVYNASAGKWENGAGGGALVVTLDKSNDYRADKTSAEIFDAITRAVFRAAVGPGVFQLFTLQIYSKVVDSEDTYYTFIIGEYIPGSGYEQIELMGIGGDSYPQMTID